MSAIAIGIYKLFCPFKTRKLPLAGQYNQLSSAYAIHQPQEQTDSGVCTKPKEWKQEGISTGDQYSTYIQIHRKRKQARGKRGGKKKKKAQKLLGKGIFNLTNVQFTQEELRVLELGLKYAPDKPFDKFEAFIDLQKFLRKLNIKNTLP